MKTDLPQFCPIQDIKKITERDSLTKPKRTAWLCIFPIFLQNDTIFLYFLMDSKHSYVKMLLPFYKYVLQYFNVRISFPAAHDISSRDSVPLIKIVSFYYYDDLLYSTINPMRLPAYTKIVVIESL